ncbi:702_t:CDS:2 [Acaulospora morrowiae]|uniref:702_t:CDS:1 n=1 Tax=Acaulospora morrowiae TaxID=94023 RepID=A0A9N9B2Q8_9GLOM|nr:702_t:CDS:2 [Acaulospora morrowiae]
MNKTKQVIRFFSAHSSYLQNCLKHKALNPRGTFIFQKSFSISKIGTRVSLYSTQPLQPPGPPTDPRPTPPPEPAGVNTPIDSLPPPEKTGSSITFPWLYSNQPPRITNYPYVISKNRSFLTKIIALLPIFIQHEICMWVTTKILRGATSPAYFPDEFLIGASYAIRHVCATLSTPPDREMMEQMFMPRLYDRFNAEIDKITSEKSSVMIDIQKIHNCSIRDIWMTVGPRKATEKRSEDDDEKEKYRMLRWMTIKIGVQRGNENMSYIERKEKVSKAFAEGFNFKVDVNFDADIAYQLKSSEGQILINDQVRRPLVVRFESPYFEPSEKIYKKLVNNEGRISVGDEDDFEINWNWRVGDIDYLLGKEDLENEIKEEEMKTRGENIG